VRIILKIIVDIPHGSPYIHIIETTQTQSRNARYRRKAKIMNYKSRYAHRIAFLTRDVAKLDLSHVRDINRIMRSRGNFANDRRAHDTIERQTISFSARTM